MVAHLERSKKKSWIIGAIGLGVVAALAVGIVIYRQQAAETSAAVVAEHQGVEEAVYAERVLYDAPKIEPAEPEGSDQAGATTSGAGVEPSREGGTTAARAARRKRDVAEATPTPATPRTVKVVSKTEERAVKATNTFRKMSADEYRALTKDELGKGEVKVDFDPFAEARRHEEEQAKDRAAKASERSVKVAEAFGKKRRQFRRCTDERQERVKVVFTVLPNGKVSEVTVSNTASTAKAACIEKILGRTIFPPGADTQTYSQTLVL